MPFCPKCKNEFVEGISTCPDCGEKMVDSLPDENVVPVKWVKLATLSSPVMANMVVEALRNKNIRASIAADVLSSTLLAQTTATAGSYAKIYVPQEDLKEAEVILESMARNQ